MRHNLLNLLVIQVVQEQSGIEGLCGGFFEAQKPVGAICIASAMVAFVLHTRHDSAALTLGNDVGVTEAMTQLGQQYTSTPIAKEIVIDEAPLSDVFIGITCCVAEVLKRL